MRIRKLKPKVARSLYIPWTLVGGLLTRDIAPTDRASPKMRSASDSILARGFCWGCSGSVRGTVRPGQQASGLNSFGGMSAYVVREVSALILSDFRWLGTVDVLFGELLHSF
jgi:hypothetical protein